MFRDNSSVEKLSAELQKKNRQLDMLDSQINKLNQDLESAKKQVTDLKKDNIAKTSRCTELEATNERLAKDIKSREQKFATLQGQVDSLKSPSSRASPISRTFSQSTQPSTPVSPAASIDTSNSESEALRTKVSQLQAEIDRLSISAKSPTASSASAQQRQQRGFGTSFLSGGGGGGSAIADISKMRTLTDEVSMWKSKAEGLMSELKIAQRKAASALSDADRASERAAQAADARIRAEALLKTAQAEASQLRDLADQSSKSLRTQLKRSEGETVRIAADADKVSTQIDTMQRRIDALMTEKSTLEMSLSDAVTAATKARDAARLMQSDNTELEKQLDEKTIQLAAAWADVERYKLGKETADAQFAALTDKLTGAHADAAAQEARARELAGRAGEESENALDVIRQLHAMQERAEAAELATEALKAKIVILDGDIQIAREQQVVVTQALETAQSQLTDVAKEGSESAAGRAAAVAAHARLETRIEDLSAQVASRDATIVELTEVLDALRNDLSSKTQELTETKELIDNAEGALGTVKTKSTVEISGLHTTLESQTKDLEKAVAAAAAAEELAKDAVAARENALRAQSKAMSDLESMKIELEDVRAGAEAEAERADALAQLLEEREAELSKVRISLSKAEVQARQAESLEEQSAADQAKVEATHRELSVAAEALAACKEELAAKHSSLENALAAVKDREGKVERLGEELRDAAARYEAQSEALAAAEDRIAEYEQASVEDKMKIGDAKGITRDAELAAADARKEIGEIAEELQRTRAALREAEERLEAADKTIAVLNDALDDVRGAANSDLAYKRRAAELEEEMKCQAEELEAAKIDVINEKQKSAEALMRAASMSPEKLSPRKRSGRSSPVKGAPPQAHINGEEEEEDDSVLVSSIISSAFKKALDDDDGRKSRGDDIL